jgi:hypothetical protein
VAPESIAAATAVVQVLGVRVSAREHCVVITWSDSGDRGARLGDPVFSVSGKLKRPFFEVLQTCTPIRQSETDSF